MVGDIKNTKLGGSDMPLYPTSYAPKGEDFNATNDRIADMITANLLKSCRTNLQQLKWNGNFDNGDGQVVDIFSDASGANDSINTVLSTVLFSTDKYILDVDSETPELSTAISQNFGDNGLITYNLTAISQGIISKIIAYNTSTGTVTVNIKNSGGTIIASKIQSITGEQEILFNAGDYSEFIAIGSFSIEVSTSGGNNRVYNTASSFSGTYFSYTSQLKLPAWDSAPTSPLEFTAINGYESDGTLISESNTTPLDGTELFAVVRNEGDIPTDTSIDVNVTDRTGTGDGNDDTDATGIVSDSDVPSTSTYGVEIEALTDVIITKVTKLSTLSTTTAEIINQLGDSIEVATFVGDVATFSKNIFLKTGDKIGIVLGQQDVSITHKWDTSNTYPIVGTNIQFTGGLSSNRNTKSYSLGTTNLYDVLSVDTQNATDNGISGELGELLNISSLGAVDNLKVTLNLGTTDNTKTPTSEGISFEVTK